MPLSHFFTFIIGYYLNKKKNASENTQRVPPPRNSPPVFPPSEDLSPVSPQVSQDSVPPLVELHNEQDQDNVSNRRTIREQNEANQETQVPRKRGRSQQNLNNQEIREEQRKRGRGQQNLNNQNNTTKKRTKK